MKGQVTIGPLAASAIGFASSNEEAGRIAKTVLAYLAGNGVEALLPPHIKDECDELIRLAQISRRNGAKGGRPKTQNNPDKTQTKPRNNPDETQIESRAQEETTSLMEENLPSLSKEKREHSSLKENPLPPPSEPPVEPPAEPADFELVAELAKPVTVAKPTASAKKFRKPDVFEVAAYCQERGIPKSVVDPAQFVDYNEARGWTIGKSPMKDWKAAVRTWQRMHEERGSSPRASADPTKFYNPEGTGTDWSKLGQTYGSSPITTPTPQTF